MSERVDLLSQWGDSGNGPESKPIQLVRLDANEVAVVPFTKDVTPVKLHYCEQPEIKGYVHCNGTACVLCRAGRAVDDRVLLPVYVPGEKAVGVLPISPSSRPGALRPQIMPILRSGKRVAILIRKPDRARFDVSTVALSDGMDDGAKVIADFKSRWDAGEIDLALVYQRLENRDLAEVPSIASMLRLKGINSDELG